MEPPVVGEDVVGALDLFAFRDLVAFDSESLESLLLFIVGLIVEDESLKDFEIREGMQDFKNLLVNLFGSGLEEFQESLHLETWYHFIKTLG